MCKEEDQIITNECSTLIHSDEFKFSNQFFPPFSHFLHKVLYSMAFLSNKIFVCGFFLLILCVRVRAFITPSRCFSVLACMAHGMERNVQRNFSIEHHIAR